MIQRRQIVRFVIGILGLGLTLLCCGKSKKTPVSTNIDGLASDWDGLSDYPSGDWRFATP